MNNWPVEYADQLVLGNLESNVAVCCLWSVRDRLRLALDPASYSVIGNLYSRAGISPMLRNLLANPLIRYLVITGKSLTDSDEALLHFLQYGVDADFKIIGNGGQIDPDLPLEALQELREHIQLLDMRGTHRFADEFKIVSSTLRRLPPYAEPRTFPKRQASPSILPSETAGYLARGRTIADTWLETLQIIMAYGNVSGTDYGLQQKEVLALLSVVEEPSVHVGKVPEWAPFTASDVERYIDRFFNREKSEEIAYNYGYRLQKHWGADQIGLLAAELQRAGHSRRALASLWDPVGDSTSADPPCITTVQGVVRAGQLHLTAYIRSNDMFRAYPLNAAALAELQARIAQQLDGVGLGSLSIFSYSAHIYSDCWDLCRPALTDAAQQQRFEQDPRGSFVFHTDDGRLAAEHYSPVGDLLQTFTADTSRELMTLIAPYVSRVDHAMYLGKEIDRLWASLQGNTQYTQDRV